MKKFFLPVIVIVILFLGTGYFYFSKKGHSSNPPEKNQTAQPEDQEKSGVFNSLKDALNANQSIKCEFTDDQGRKTSIYFKGNLARGVYQGSGEMNNFLYRDDKMYLWDEENKEGFIMPIPTSSVTGTEKRSEISDIGYIEAYEKYWNMCQITEVDNALFSLPADIQFQDMSALQQMIEE